MRLAGLALFLSVALPVSAGELLSAQNGEIEFLHLGGGVHFETGFADVVALGGPLEAEFSAHPNSSYLLTLISEISHSCEQSLAAVPYGACRDCVITEFSISVHRDDTPDQYPGDRTDISGDRRVLFLSGSDFLVDRCNPVGGSISGELFGTEIGSTPAIRALEAITLTLTLTEYDDQAPVSSFHGSIEYQESVVVDSSSWSALKSLYR